MLGVGEFTFISLISQPAFLPYFALVPYISYYPHLRMHGVVWISGEYRATILSFQDLYDFVVHARQTCTVVVVGKGFVISFIYIVQAFVSFSVFLSVHLLVSCYTVF